jgi:hypothetical protein
MVENGFQFYKDSQLVDSLYDALDANRDGTIDKHELCAGLMILSSGTLDKKLQCNEFLK